MDKKKLFIELQSMQGQGIMLYLDGQCTNARTVAEVITVQEDISYMRDYVYDEGVLKELHFDKVTNK